MEKRIRRTLVLWSKTDIATALNISHEQLNLYVSQKAKDCVEWKRGQQRFRDSEVLEILKDLFPAKSESERRDIIGYKPVLEIDFNKKW